MAKTIKIKKMEKNTERSFLIENIIQNVHPLLVLDSRLRVRFANKPYYQTFRTSENQTEGRLIFDLNNRQWDVPILRKLLNRVIRKKTAFVGLEITREFPGIGEKIVMVNCRYMPIGKNRDILILLAIEDATEHRKRQKEVERYHETIESLLEERKEALEISEKKYRTLYESVRDGIAKFDMNGRITECNQAYLNMLGYSIKEITKLTYQQITPEKWHKMESNIIKDKILKRGYSDVYEKEYIKKNGNVFPIEITRWLIKDEKGKPQGTWGIIRDITARKQAEEEMTLHDTILADMAEGVYLIKADDGTIIYTNRTFEKMFGYGPGEMIGKNVSIVNAPSDITPRETAAKISKILHKKRVWSGEVYNIKKDGTPFWCHATVSGFQHHKYGAVWVSVHEDITERKKIEDSLRLMSAAVENAPDGIQIVDLNGYILYSNAAVKTIYGFSPAELKGKHVETMNLDSFFAQKTIIPQIKKTGYWTGEVMVKHRNGKSFPVWLTASLVKDNKGKLMAMIGVIRDMTERKMIISQLEQTKAQDEALLESVGDGLFAVNREEKIIALNHQAEIFLGISKKEIVGRPYYNFWEVSDDKGNILPLAKRPINLALNTGEKVIIGVYNNYWYIRKDKTRFPVSINASPVILNGKIIGVIGLFKDISKEKEIDRARNEFVSLASHQLRTAPTTINWYSEILLSEKFGTINKNQREYLEEIYSSNQRMIALINALLNVTRIESERIKIEPKPITLGPYLKEIIDEIRKMGRIEESRNYEISLHLEKSMEKAKTFPGINVDPVFFRQAINNIIINAIQYSKPNKKGIIEVSLERREKDYFIKIQDNGIGIPKDAQSKIFEKFFRADNARAQVPNGTGLGLYIVKTAIEKAGGKIWFESKEGKGTTFYMSIPLTGMKKTAGEIGLVEGKI